ncbi:hypothetical protein IWW34DRAFT_773254 [Fusarium oxysporum f. sp. albedinis]|nr:hypothetical protein IWW34DRAFT_773254 [Fusarium oxysporum f. sp. albedinis]
MSPSHFFDNITISLRHWCAPYSAKHVQGIHFDMSGRTFRIATGATCEAWFIVMHPDQTGQSSSGRSRKSGASSQTKTALTYSRAILLASYIKDMFLCGDLLREGIEPRWKLGGAEAQMIGLDKWVTCQAHFMKGETVLFRSFTVQSELMDRSYQTRFPSLLHLVFGGSSK